MLIVLLVSVADHRSRWIVLGTAAALTSATFALPAVRDRVTGAGLAGETAQGRWLLWQDAARLSLHHPFLGVGPGGFEEAIRGVHGSHWYAVLGTDNPPDSPHSWPLEVLLAGGPLVLAGVLTLGVLLVRAVWGQVAATRKDGGSLEVGLLAALVGYAVALLVHFTGPGHTPLAAMFAGALLAVAPAQRTVRSVAGRAAEYAAWAMVALAGLAAVAEIPLRQAVVALQQGNGADADGYFDAAAAMRWWDPQIAVTASHAFTVAGVAAQDAGNLSRATSWLRSSQFGVNPPVGVLFDTGRADEARGDLSQAATALDHALRGDPANPDVLLLRGVVAARQQQWSAAESFFRSAIPSAPRSRAPWENLAQLYRMTGRPEAAAAAAEHAAQLPG